MKKPYRLLRWWTLANNIASERQVVQFLVVVLFAYFFEITVGVAQVSIPRLEHRVTDLTDTLSTYQQAALEDRLASFEQQKGSQIAVLIIPTTQPEDIAHYSIRVVDQWRLGRKGTDDGVLILLAKNDRTTRIEVGYGLEGVIPDAVAKRIIEGIMIPHFRQGGFAAGINAGVDRLIGLIQRESLPEAEPSKTNIDQGENFSFVMLVVALFSGGILRRQLGKFLGGLVNAGLIGLLVWFLVGGLSLAILFGVMAFIITLINGRSNRGRRGCGFEDGFGDGEGYSGGGFSGGGGGFGGGGASGNW